MLNKLKENKLLRVIYNIFYYALVLLVLAILLVVILQRVSNNTISLGGFRIFKIVSESMVPKYELGDVLLAKTKDVEKISIGTDIIYRGDEGDFTDRIVTHQVIDIEDINGEYVFHTKGLANETEDPTISEDQILGVVIYKSWIFSTIMKIMNNLYSFYFVIFVPVVILIFLDIRKIIINFKKDEE